ncbi:MAG: enoyl-CoA hydratase [Proteobacteria bacterium]|nr:MAG: enoyl-CoA hydratase [Pseudomonadota bacterium]
MTDVVSTSIDARGVATLTLKRPEKHNALDQTTVRALHDALAAVEADPNVRVVVLTGAGASFCAGADIAHMRTMLHASEAENVADARLLADCLHRLDTLERPVVARINGNAFGGGVGLVACADVAIAVETACFALTEVRLGIVPATISPYVIAAIGARAARRLFLTAERFDAREAQRLGLVHAAVPAPALDAAIAAQVDALLKGGPRAIRAAKRLVRRVGTIMEHDTLAAETAELLARLRASPEGKEGLSAFLERRAPGWVDASSPADRAPHATRKGSS